MLSKTGSLILMTLSNIGATMSLKSGLKLTTLSITDKDSIYSLLIISTLLL